jgi:hypothetical protein
MAEILIKAIDYTHSDPDKDRRGSYKKGMPVVIFEDGHLWGAEEGLPKFVIIKIPGVSVNTVQKYINPQLDTVADASGNFPIYCRRLWRIRWEDLPTGAKTKLADGELIIKAGTYNGTYDYTWSQIKTYFRNNQTGIDEMDDL